MGLREGKISNKELAEWFGISANSFSKNKEKKLEELKYFAEFHIDNKNHVIIDKIYNDVYNRQGKANYQKIKEKIDNVWNKDGLDSCKRVGEEIYKDLIMEDEDFKLKPSTVYNYTREGRNELYGKPFGAAGERGSSIAVLCKKVKDDSEDGYHIEPLTEKETKIKDQLFTLYYGKDSQKAKLLIEMAKDGEFPKEELYDRIDEQTNLTSDEVWVRFLVDLRAKTGAEIVRATLVKENE